MLKGCTQENVVDMKTTSSGEQGSCDMTPIMLPVHQRQTVKVAAQIEAAKRSQTALKEAQRFKGLQAAKKSTMT